MPSVPKKVKTEDKKEFKKEVKQEPVKKENNTPPKIDEKPMRVEENTSERPDKSNKTIAQETPPQMLIRKQEESLKQMMKQPSKDKIQVFEESDDEEIDKHLQASRQNLRDPMDVSEPSIPPTPEKVVQKIVEATGSSVQLTEGALKDAQNYVQVLYDRNHNLEKQLNVPFDYGVQIKEEQEFDFKEEMGKKRSSNNLKRKNQLFKFEI